MQNENKNTNVIFSDSSAPSAAAPVSDVQEPPSSLQAFSLDPADDQATAPQAAAVSVQKKVNPLVKLAKRADVMLVFLLILGGIGLAFMSSRGDNSAANTASDRFETTEIPLADFVSDAGISFGAQSVVINGALQANDAFIISPSLQPANATAGQIYYDQATNQLAYYNGTQFVALAGQTNQQQVTAGAGLALVGGQLSNSGVLSLQGLSGDVTLNAGNGIAINGTTISNSGIVSVSSATPSLTVTNDGNGNVTLAGSGSGTVSSPGGNSGNFPLFTGSQTIDDSIVTQTGLTVTITGDLSVVTGGLTLSNALTVSNGGTGATSLSLNGVLVGQGTSAITSVAAGGIGLCLISTAGAPTWAACPGGAGVTSLNGQTGAVNVANASGASGTITIDDASTSVKGIAQFNATNFSVGTGIVNTIQNINTGATPTFAGVNTNSITPSAALTVGATGQQLTLQGNGSTALTATADGFTTTVGFSGTAIGNVIYQFDRTVTAGTYGVCTTAGNCVGTGGGVSTPGGITNRLAKFTAAQSIDDSTITDDGTNVTTSVDLVIQGGSITVGVPSSQSGAITLAHSGSANTGMIVQGALAGNRTYTLPDASGEVCLSIGNCSGSGSSNTLQAAYAAGSVISTTDARDIDIELANTATDSNFDIVVKDDSTGFASISREDGTGTNSPAQLLVIDNLDGNQPIANGITVRSAAGGITDGVDASDPEIVNAINVGDNVIIGGVALIDFTNFDVNGAGNVTAGGNVNLSGGGQYQISGVQISSANLSNDANLAKLNASQTFTGNSNAFQNGTNSTNAFNVQNASGTRVLTVDTSNGEVELGVGSTLDGRLVFNNVSNTNAITIVPGTPSAPRTITLPDSSGIVCLDSGNCAGAGSTLQTAYNFSAGGTTPKIKVNSGLGGVDIQDADSTIGANLLNVRASNGSGLGSVMFGVTSTGQVVLQNASNSTTALRVLTQGGTNVLTVDTTNGQLLLGQSSTLNGTIVFNNSTNANQTTLTTAAASGPQTVTLPDASGTICLSVGNCSGAGSSNTLQASYDAGNTIDTSNGRDIDFDLIDTATDANFLVDLQCDTSCSTNGRFAVQDDGVDVFAISPAGGLATFAANVTMDGDLAVNGGDLTSSGALNITPGGALAVGATGQTLTLQGSIATITSTGVGNDIIINSADAILLQDSTTVTGGFTHSGGAFSSTSTGSASLTASGALTITAGGGSTWSTSSGNLTVSANGTSTLSLQTSGAGTVSLGNQNTTTINIGAGSNIVRTIHIGDAGSSQAQTITVGSTGGASATTIQGGSGNVVLTTSTGNRVQVGSAVTDATSVLLTVDSYNNGTDPTGTNGSMYYNTTTDMFRCFQAGAWMDCITASGGLVSLQNAYTNSTGGTTPEAKLDSTRGAVDIQDADSTIGANLLNVRASNGSGLGTILFGVGNTGDILSRTTTNSTTALQVQNANSNTIFDVDTTNQRLGINTNAPSSLLQVNQSNLTPGTVSNTASTTSVTGSGTSFFDTFQRGDTFTITSSGNTCTIQSITSNTALTCTTTLAGSSSGSAYSFTQQARVVSRDNGTTSLNGTVIISSPSSNNQFTFRNDTSTNTLKIGSSIIGNASNDGGNDSNASYIQATKFNSGPGGSISSLRVFFPSVDGVSPGFKVAVYSDSAGSPNSLLSSATAPSTTATALQWTTASLGTTITLLPNTDYWLATTQQSGSTQFRTQTGGTNTTKYQSGFTYSNNFPASYTVTDTTGDIIAIYGPYTSITDQSNVSAALTISENNDVSVRPLYNSDTAFEVLRADGVQLFNVNTQAGWTGMEQLMVGAVDTTYNAYIAGNGSSGALGVYRSSSTITDSIMELFSNVGGTETLKMKVTADGTLELAGGGTKNITTASASSATAIGIQPGDSTASNGTGAALNLTGGNATSNTCGTACAGGNVVIQGGSATGSSGTRNGGSVSIDAGTGSSANGSINIGTNSSANVTIGRTTGGSSTTLQAGTGGVNVGIGGVANTIQIGNTTGAVAQTINIGNNATASSTNTVVLGSTIGSSATTIQGGTGDINITSTDRVLVSTVAGNAISGFSLNTTMTNGSGLQAGNRIAVTLDPGGTSSGSHLTNQTVVDLGSTGTTFTGDIVAHLGQINWGGATNTSNTGRIVGAAGKVVTNSGAGSVQNAVALFSQFQYAVGTTVTNSYNVYASNLQNGSTTNLYGFYAERMTGGTNNYPLYLASSTANQAIMSVTGAGAVLLRNDTNSSAAFQLQNSSGQAGLNVDTNTSNLISNPSFETNTTGWAAHDAAAIARVTNQSFDQQAGLEINATAGADDGARFSFALASSTQYSLSMYVKGDGAFFSTLQIGRSENGTVDTSCATGLGTSSSNWNRVTCTFTTGTVTGSPYIYIKQTDATDRTFYIDAVQLETAASATQYRTAKATINGNLVVNAGQNSLTNATLFVQTNAGGEGAVFRGNGDSNILQNVLTAATASGTTIFNVNDTALGTTAQGGSTFFDSAAFQAISTAAGARALDVFGASGQTADIMRVRANGGTTLLSVGSAGAVTSQNSTDSTTAFRVLNSTGAGSVPQFVVDTSNSRVYIGNPTGDTTGALLVIDTKTSAGDPTGVDGAMYYNSATATFRCHQDGFWRNCIDSARSTYHVYYELNGDGSNTEISTYQQGSGTPSPTSGSTGHPGVMGLQVSTSAASDLAAIQSTSQNDDTILLGNGDTWRYETALRTPTNVSDGTNTYFIRAGFTDAYDGGAADGADGCYFKYSHGINSGRWQGLCISNSSPNITTCDLGTGTTVAANTWYRLTVTVNSAGNSADFRVNGSTTNGAGRCQVTTNIPTGASRHVGFGAIIYKTLGSTARTMLVDYLDIIGDLGTPR